VQTLDDLRECRRVHLQLSVPLGGVHDRAGSVWSEAEWSITVGAAYAAGDRSVNRCERSCQSSCERSNPISCRKVFLIYWTLTIAIPAVCGTGCRDPVGVRWPVL